MAYNGLVEALLGPSNKLAVWNKGHIIFGRDPTEWRKDDCGYIIRFSDYGERHSHYGWEIDHIVPTSRGGADELYNKRPLHWQVNAFKGASTSGIFGGLADLLGR